MRPLPDAIPNATMVLRRLQESLWLQNNNGRMSYVTLDSQGRADYPIVSGSSVLYDFPERLSAPFKKMVWMTLQRKG